MPIRSASQRSFQSSGIYYYLTAGGDGQGSYPASPVCAIGEVCDLE